MASSINLQATNTTSNDSVIVLKNEGTTAGSNTVVIPNRNFTMAGIDEVDALRSMTLLADYPARKYNGTITLAEPLTNFEYIVVEAHDDASADATVFTYLPTALMNIGQMYDIYPRDTYYAMWIYTNTTTLTFNSEFSSWIRKIYGIGRK